MTSDSNSTIEPSWFTFGRCVCGAAARPPEDNAPAWAVNSGYSNCIQVFESSIAGELKKAQPKVGEALRLELSFPFEGRIGDTVRFLWRPPLLAANGFDHPLDGLQALCLVEVRLTHIESEVMQDAWRCEYRAGAGKTLSVLTLDDLQFLPPRTEGRTDYCTYRKLFDGHQGNLHVAVGSFEGDLNNWCLMHEHNGVVTLLAASESGFCCLDAVHFGRRILTEQEYASLNRLCE